MSEEIKEFAPIVDMPKAGPKFDPTKKYRWEHDAQFVLSGNEFGQLLNALRVVTSTKEAQAIILAKDAADALENVLASAVETGLVVEHIDNKASL